MKIKKTLGAIALTTALTFSTMGNTALAASPFEDVPENYWGYEAISTLAEQGIINGFGDGTYRPYEELSRSQGAIIIGKTLDVDTDIPNPHNFSDVGNKLSGQKYIKALADMGVFANVDKFNPHNPLTRAQMAKVLVYAFGLEGSSDKEFEDVPDSHWSADNISTLVATGVTAGTSEVTFSPNDTVTRSQMAAFVHRTMNYLNEDLSVEEPKEEDKEEEVNEETPQEPEDKEEVEDKEESTDEPEKVEEEEERNEDGKTRVGASAEFSQEVFELMNKEREERGLEPLKYDPEIEELANMKAKDFYDNEYLAHNSPTYGSPGNLVREIGGLDYLSVGENIARGYQTPEDVMEGWMNSEGHKNNILAVDHSYVGVGYYEVYHEEADYSYGYWVQLFADK